MKYFVLLSMIILLGALVVWNFSGPEISPLPPSYIAEDREAVTTTGDTRNPPRVEIVAEGLSIPWEILFLPDGELLVTERDGRVILLKQEVEIPITGVKHVGEGGLLGATLHPDFSDNHFVYFYQTTEIESGLINRVNRYKLLNNELIFDRTIVDNLPGANYHDGGRIKFGPDGFLYVTLGDAGNENLAQNIENLAGSILRYTAEGEIPRDNSFGNAIYSYGHRNPQGLAWDEAGNLWSTEHGRSGARSGFDELNLIIKDHNYGWPVVEGDTTTAGADSPIRHSGSDTTWAPGGLAYLDGNLYIPGLRGETLYKASLAGEEVMKWEEYFVEEYGRLRTVVVGPDNLLYVTTSNRDGRGNPAENDDLIIRINPKLLDE